MLDSPDWPSAYEQYRGGLIVMRPFNATKATVQQVKRDLDATVLMYWDSTDMQVTTPGECAPHAPKRDCDPSGPQQWTHCASGAVACCQSYNCSAFTAPTCPPDAFSRAAERVASPAWAIRRLPADGGAPIPVCWYGFGPMHVHTAASNAALVPFLAGWVRDHGFDGIYLDEYFQTFRYDLYLAGYPAGTLFDATGDGRADTAAAMESSYLKFRPLFTKGLRAALGPDAIMVANTITAVDPSLNGLTIEACDEESVCAAKFAAQAKVAHAPMVSVMWLKGSSPNECSNAASLRARFPFLLEGTDFYDGTHVVCNHTTTWD